MTQIRIGIEDLDGRALAWALDYPGCFAYGADGPAAVIAMATAMVRYKEWIEQRAEQPWLSDLAEMDFRLVEEHESYRLDENFELVSNGGRLINAWFRHDWKPLTEDDVAHGLEMLTWTRADLLDVVRELTPEQMQAEHAGEDRTIAGILAHVAGGEYYYLDRLDQAGIPRAELPRDPFERLTLVRQRLNAVLPELVGRSDLVRGKDGQFWSPRRVLRYALWHERDHWMHISKILLETM